MTLLEILSLYLPHNVKLKNKFSEIVELNGIIGNTAIYEYDPDEDEVLYFEDFGSKDNVIPSKLLLYPLSMLTEEIEHEGERFIPMKRLQSLFGGREVRYDGMCFYNRIETSVVRGPLHDEIPQHFSQWQCYQKMFEWHIDLFGLIGEGKAIDKSKLSS